MKTNYRWFAVMLGALGLTLSMVPTGAAQCLSGSQPPATHRSWHSRPGRLQLLPAAFVRVDDGDDHDENDASIVGFWHQKLISQGSAGIPDGTVLDDGLGQWHSDGTEILNSNRATISGDFCVGVWEKVSPNTYKLNHFALPYDSTGTVFVGPVNLRAVVTLAAGGKQYKGTFTLDQYDPTGKTMTSSAQGVITGTRITVESRPSNIF